jgi:hypothetical protein
VCRHACCCMQKARVEVKARVPSFAIPTMVEWRLTRHHVDVVDCVATGHRALQRHALQEIQKMTIGKASLIERHVDCGFLSSRCQRVDPRTTYCRAKLVGQEHLSSVKLLARCWRWRWRIAICTAAIQSAILYPIPRHGLSQVGSSLGHIQGPSVRLLVWRSR